MKRIRVRGISQKGKNRIRERGDVWNVKEVADKVFFSSEQGPWMLLESLDGRSWRWMHAVADKDFERVEE